MHQWIELTNAESNFIMTLNASQILFLQPRHGQSDPNGCAIVLAGDFTVNVTESYGEIVRKLTKFAPKIMTYEQNSVGV